MDIGQYTFAQFKERSTAFHGYPAPGLLIGAYMVEMVKAALPAGVLFEAMVESGKCLPDAVQLLTVCSTGNNRLKIVNLGRYALSLFDKNTGEGFRVHLDVEKLKNFPEVHAWFFKTKAKAEQDEEQLLREIEKAGDSICAITPIRIHKRFLGHSHMGKGTVCPCCGEAYPASDGNICRGCQGEAPYDHDSGRQIAPDADFPRISVLSAEQAIGQKALHDMISIVPDVFKGTAIAAGQRIGPEDVEKLHRMGRYTIAVEQGTSPSGTLHENEAAEKIAGRMGGANISPNAPEMGRVAFKASIEGLFSLDIGRLTALNMNDKVMCAARQDGTFVAPGSSVAVVRIIPLFLEKNAYAETLSQLERPLFSVLPLRKARVGILVTGTEVFNGLVEDKFIPRITAKVEQYACNVVKTVIAPDDMAAIGRGIEEIRAAGADLLVATGGLSVDPGDLTRTALLSAGLCDALYGAPVLPGSMILVGRMGKTGEKEDSAKTRSGDSVRQPMAGEMQVVGVPAGALYHKTTLFDALLPRLLAGRIISRLELARMGDGGLCMNCKICAWPKCFFMK
ncbi:MAG: FmdE family protein [Desulfovibrio sp.]|nr:FmdE family protein [Desulfovibrio sp.]